MPAYVSTRYAAPLVFVDNLSDTFLTHNLAIVGRTLELASAEL